MPDAPCRPRGLVWLGIQAAALAACTLLPGLAASADMAHQTLPGVSPVAKASNGPNDPAELARFIDGVMRDQFEAAYLAGAAVAVVQNGQVLLKKGYGYADLARKKKVDPDQTLFRIGSVSKLLTATAVMQQVERGQLALNADVNDYLNRFQLPATWPAPVTLRNLLTHTAGFEVNTFGYTMASGPSTLQPLGQVMERHMPARVRPPVTDFAGQGQDAAYSNYGFALAGYLVQQSAGQSFVDYTQENLFQPLGMQRSTFREPLPEAWQADMSVAYSGGDPFVPHGFQYYGNLAPAGSMSTTAADMARFMIAQLQLGQYQGKRILSEAGTRLMQSRVFSPNPYINGSGLGWVEKYQNGHRLIWHGGLTVYFYSELYLLPEHDLGLFVVYNTQPPSDMMYGLMNQFMQQYFPADLPEMPPTTEPGLTTYAGNYASMARSFTTWEKLYLLLSPKRVSATASSLGFPQPEADDTPSWLPAPQQPNVLRWSDQDALIHIKHTADGDRYIIGPDPAGPDSKLGWAESQPLNLAVLGLCLLSFVAAIAWAVLCALRRLQYADQGLPRLLAAALGLTNLALLAGLADTLLLTSPYAMLAHLPWSLYLAMSLSLLTVALTAALLVAISRRWPAWPRGLRLAYGAQALLAVLFVTWLHFWNLIGFQVA